MPKSFIFWTQPGELSSTVILAPKPCKKRAWAPAAGPMSSTVPLQLLRPYFRDHQSHRLRKKNIYGYIIDRANKNYVVLITSFFHRDGGREWLFRGYLS